MFKLESDVHKYLYFFEPNFGIWKRKKVTFTHNIALCFCSQTTLHPLYKAEKE